jgi:dihydrofolate synthase/folylpolyglutamate synthase
MRPSTYSVTEIAMPATWSYDEAIRYLNSRTNYEKKLPSYGPVILNLERMRRLNDLLGRPHDRFRSIHITGTKGKGSTAFMAASVLDAAGLKVGVYTSPHLVDLEERIRVNGKNIPKQALADVLQRIRGPVEQIRFVAPPPHPTFFEILTTAAFLHFADERVDWAVVEVGLGGRLDSTNIIRPEVAAVTTVGLDHTHQLGDTVELIAGEKAGIFKRGVPVILGPQEPRARRVLLGRAKGADARVWSVDREIRIERLERTGEEPGYRFDVVTPFASHRGCRIALIGKHQVQNAAVAVGIFDALAQNGKVDVAEEALRDGLASVEVPARVELLGRSPWVILDGAHNPMSVAAVIDAVREQFRYRRLVLLFAMATDKDIPTCLDLLLPHADETFFTVTNSPRAEKPEALRQMAEARGKTNLHCEPDEKEAFRRALSACGEDDLLLVTGSLYLAGDLRPTMLEVLGERPAASRPGKGV